MQWSISVCTDDKHIPDAPFSSRNNYGKPYSSIIGNANLTYRVFK